ncbi:homogentisate phytyltransferase [Neolewinella agarilytica]|uniref:Homogentisate phytyltransferase n=1 Tax=Neolewinella agarilytica TaxID=478744 RepID=A0A1H9D2D1_9BACT|nr:homogentisate phytyltransferase [Neolewinella agarilytica]SEQ07541.1 homogentisate phytyltransferase [Neolewinella agarilytica]
MITFLRFARAHTVIGTSLSLLALYLMAARHVGVNDWMMFALSLFSCLAANVYITGLNQLTDIDIDKINKPYLPLASGAYSPRTGQWIVGVCGLLAVLSCLVYPPYLPLTVLSSLFLGTIYSAEPIRLKRYHFWAAFCIIVVRGLIVNLLLYLHFRTALGAGAQVPGMVWLLTFVIFVFGIIIAWFKDLPDTEGDKEHGIQTLTLVRTRKWVYTRGAGLLGGTLLSAAIYAFWVEQQWIAAGLVVLLLFFGYFTTRLDLDDQQSIARFYQSTWGVFFGVYLVFAVWG